MSGFKESYIITADLSGDSRSTVLYYAKDGNIKELKCFLKPNSLGLFYALITQYLGFQYNNDECKTMALAAYGKPLIDLSWLLKVNSGGYKLNLKYIDSRFKPGESNPSFQEPVFTSAFVKRIKENHRLKNEKFRKFHKDLAKASQDLLENVYFNLLNYLDREVKCDTLCLAGGIALNSELNSKLLYSNRLKQLFVQPVANDAGLALGAAVYYSYMKGEFHPFRLKHLYFGESYDNDCIKDILNRLGISYRYFENIEREIARALAGGKIVAVFNGAMEYGPRALGNRSVLADPGNSDFKYKINTFVKLRENFQPFAPSILKEKANDFYEFPANSRGNFEFMVINAIIKKAFQKLIPAVVHINSTSRIQIVDKDNSPSFYKILNLFENFTGIPVLLNTSLNVKGKPIARSPEDALEVFVSTAIDCLALGNFWIEK